jgi:Pin2-interacting protein X1
LDYDPNNTRWTRDETTFGQKILRAQGWEPGKYLGAQESSHARLHSVASLAPIKINLKDDTLGLGAKIRQKQSDECTGLDVFKDLLGRLNGKSEDVIAKERQVRSDIKTNLVVERKYGPMRFVSGGLLVGDHMKMAELVDNNKSTPTAIRDEPTSEVSEIESWKKEKKDKREKESRKRKVRESQEADASDNTREKKRKKRSKDRNPDADDTEVEKSPKKKAKKGKKSKRSEEDAEQVKSEVKRKKSKKSKDAPQQEHLLDDSTQGPEDISSEKARKEKKKDKKRKQTDSKELSAVTTTTILSSTTTLASTSQDSGSSTPLSTGASTPQVLSARHRARSRNIASKKLAYGNMQAMNQVYQP